MLLISLLLPHCLLFAARPVLGCAGWWLHCSFPYLHGLTLRRSLAIRAVFPAAGVQLECCHCDHALLPPMLHAHQTKARCLQLPSSAWPCMLLR
jgi:hypothetical protein